MKKNMDQKISQKLKTSLKKVEQALARDGGGLEVVKFDAQKNILSVRLLGMCHLCPMAEFTIKGFVEEELRKTFPKIKVKRVD